MAVRGSTDEQASVDAAPLLSAVQQVRDAVGLLRAHLAADTAWRSTDRDVLEAVREVAEVRSSLDEVHLRLVREVDTRGVASASPVATTPEGFLRTACLVTAKQARRDVSAARALAPGAPLEPFAGALADGRVTRNHVDVAVQCLDHLPTALLERPGAADEVASYLMLATTDATPIDLQEAARRLVASLAPTPEGRLDERSFERRFLDLGTDSTGMVVGRFQLDPVAGASLRELLLRWSGPRPAGEGPSTTDATTGTPTDDRALWGCESEGPGEPDRRPARQRRADALTHIVQVALGVEGPNRGERPRVVVHVTPEQLLAAQAAAGDGDRPGVGLPEVEGAGPIPVWAARRLACDAVVQRLVSSPTEAPLELGRTQRLASLTQRRALSARDGGCVVPGCTAPPQVCDAHHIEHWADGGPTDVGNLCLLCPAHHTAVHAGTWGISIDDEGQVWVVPPPWVDRSRRPRPAWRQRAARTRRAA